MCFDYDADWCAEVATVIDGPNERAATCFECGAKIEPGAWRRHIDQREHEQCQWCEDELGAEWREGVEPCGDGEHDYGQMFVADLCQGCCQLLAAIESVERDDDCPEYARQPAYGELGEAIRDDVLYGDGRYLARAVLDDPELANHPLVLAAKGG